MPSHDVRLSGDVMPYLTRRGARYERRGTSVFKVETSKSNISESDDAACPFVKLLLATEVERGGDGRNCAETCSRGRGGSDRGVKRREEEEFDRMLS